VAEKTDPPPKQTLHPKPTPKAQKQTDLIAPFLAGGAIFMILLLC
jgi:hypothetical protein